MEPLVLLLFISYFNLKKKSNQFFLKKKFPPKERGITCIFNPFFFSQNYFIPLPGTYLVYFVILSKKICLGPTVFLWGWTIYMFTKFSPHTPFPRESKPKKNILSLLVELFALVSPIFFLT